MNISIHATERWIDRVDPALTHAQAREAICRHARAIEKAIAFGAHFVKLGSGHKLAIEGDTVVTVLPRGHVPKPLGIGGVL